MNLYSIYENSEKNHANILCIKQDYSLIAGVFNFFWAAYHGMWIIVLLTILFNGLVDSFVMQGGYYDLAAACHVGIFLLFTLLGSNMREYYAARKGYILSDVILANSEEQAEVSYIMRKAAA